MSSYVLKKENIEAITGAAFAVLDAAKRYGASYHLNKETLEMLGDLDMHNLYRFVYITNIKAYNGRYGEEDKTLPKYTGVRAYNIENADLWMLKKAAGLFDCYMYQIAEDPVYDSPAYNAICDIYKLLCMIIIKRTVDWNGEEVEAA